ncbi:hypothetical protein [Pseudomonas syringae]|uniref:hypothetical protein n=1 Tax=Pseudomonas syringae TaxID=317 RepID=UPI001F32050E|nr:hypothetical protein [Pseudomonas syringae]MCF5724983.1 hypothetical protein [Pseudomonas syringae]
MKIMHPQSLPGLPDNVKELVSDGVYGLFSVGHRDDEYALVLGKESTAYLLSADGHVTEMVTGEEYSNLDLAEAVTFYDEYSNTVRINAA